MSVDASSSSRRMAPGVACCDSDQAIAGAQTAMAPLHGPSKAAPKLVRKRSKVRLLASPGEMARIVAHRFSHGIPKTVETAA